MLVKLRQTLPPGHGVKEFPKLQHDWVVVGVTRPQFARWKKQQPSAMAKGLFSGQVAAGKISIEKFDFYKIVLCHLSNMTADKIWDKCN